MVLWDISPPSSRSAGFLNKVAIPCPDKSSLNVLCGKQCKLGLGDNLNSKPSLLMWTWTGPGPVGGGFLSCCSSHLPCPLFSCGCQCCLETDHTWPVVRPQELQPRWGVILLTYWWVWTTLLLDRLGQFLDSLWGKLSTWLHRPSPYLSCPHWGTSSWPWPGDKVVWSHYGREALLTCF